MKRTACLILALICAVAVCGCSSGADEYSFARDYVAMDTVFSLKCGSITEISDEGADPEELFDRCEALTAEIETALSATEVGSEVYSFNSDVNALFDADPIFTDVLSSAVEISAVTGGAYDPALGTLTSLWNVKGGGPVPSEEQISIALAAAGTDNIEMDGDTVRKKNSKTKLDLGGIGKGYAAQRLAEYLFDSGVSYGIVSAGRTVGVFGDKPNGSPFKIGIANPFDTDGVVGYLYTEGGFVSVAGDYEQFFIEDGVRYHHIMDPATGRPSDSGLSSVAVMSQNGAAADALSTALMVMGYDAGIEFYRSGEIAFEAVFIGSDGKIMLTDGLEDGKFEISKDYSEESVALTAETDGADGAAASDTVIG